jgi:hypothetical protein
MKWTVSFPMKNVEAYTNASCLGNISKVSVWRCELSADGRLKGEGGEGVTVCGGGGGGGGSTLYLGTLCSCLSAFLNRIRVSISCWHSILQ